MSDDNQRGAKAISQLISKSLRQPIADSETQEIAGHIEADEQSRNFAQLSKAIQGSIAHAADTIDSDSVAAPGLTDDFKQRLKESVESASLEKLRLSQSGLINTRSHSSRRGSHLGQHEAPPEAARQVTSRFRLIRKLGQGGLGNVWLARDEKLNRNVAMKELNEAAMENPRVWQRFQREAEITGMLEHPNIVPIYQFGDDRKSAEPFYTMRFVGKRTLADAITEHHDLVEAGEGERLGLHRLLSVFLDICQAIAYAHSRGVVHRDLKPENVALDNFGQVVVLDWGLAKLIDDGELSHKLSKEATLSDSTLSQTMEGDVVGTPLYMAPEQAMGDLDRINERTDIYGLGAVLFSILTGAAPHATNLYEPTHDLKSTLEAIAQRDTPRTREMNLNLPIELDQICAKAMAKKQHLRYATVQDFAEAIERWMAGQSNKQAQYEAMRMEGRELRADLQSSVNDLERNVQFMSKLPPIQQLITAESDEDISIWRDRLATIFQGLLEANPDYKSVVYNRVEGEAFQELVRVERHTRDPSRIRVVPKSRLRNATSSDYINRVLLRKPGDGLTSLVCDPLCDAGLESDDQVGLVSAVPVYDDRTEDSFGVVMIECNINQVLRRQLNRQFKSGEVIAACDVFHVMMRNADGQIADESLGKKVVDVSPHFQSAINWLQSNPEYIDEANADVYGARIWFIPNKHGLMYLLKRG